MDLGYLLASKQEGIMTRDTRFVFCPAYDDCVDAEYRIIGCDNVSIQVAPYAGGYGVNEYVGSGEFFASRPHGIFRRLRDAQAKALEVARKG
jgi:hypothetical protein